MKIDKTAEVLSHLDQKSAPYATIIAPFKFHFRPNLVNNLVPFRQSSKAEITK